MLQYAAVYLLRYDLTEEGGLNVHRNKSEFVTTDIDDKAMAREAQTYDISSILIRPKP